MALAMVEASYMEARRRRDTQGGLDLHPWCVGSGLSMLLVVLWVVRGYAG